MKPLVVLLLSALWGLFWRRQSERREDVGSVMCDMYDWQYNAGYLVVPVLIAAAAWLL